jgi:hypothetical protein
VSLRNVNPAENARDIRLSAKIENVNDLIARIWSTPWPRSSPFRNKLPWDKGEGLKIPTVERGGLNPFQPCNLSIHKTNLASVLVLEAKANNSETS